MYTDFTSILARLLSSPPELNAFNLNREKYLQAFELSENDQNILLQIPTHEIERQSQTLVIKRMREVARFIPITFTGLGDDAKTLFRHYAYQHWPAHYNRHTLDAYQFCRYLRNHHYKLNKLEWLRIKFEVRNKPVAICTTLQKRFLPSLLIMYRYKKTTHVWRLALRF